MFQRYARLLQRQIVPLLVTGCLLIVSGVFLLAVLSLGGCPSRTVTNPQTTPFDVIPNTTFTSPTTVPSVTPAANVAASQAGAVQDQATTLYPRIAGLTVDNLLAEKPMVLTSYQGLLKGIAQLFGFAQQAQAQANANDAAVARLTAEVGGARDIVKIREQQLLDYAKKYEADMKAKDEFWQGEVTKVGIDRDKWRKKAESADAATLRWIWGGTIGIGVLCLISGGLMIWLLPVKKTAGVVLAGVGGVCICLGMAGMIYGQVMAIAGLVLGGLAMLGGIWAAIHYFQQHYNDSTYDLAAAGMEIADGLEQAFLAGAADKAKLLPFLQQAQSPLAKQLVAAATKDLAVLEATKNPFAAVLPAPAK